MFCVYSYILIEIHSVDNGIKSHLELVKALEKNDARGNHYLFEALTRQRESFSSSIALDEIRMFIWTSQVQLS